jgi:vacuolar-type H+-ATPase subunit I/STV1
MKTTHLLLIFGQLAVVLGFMSYLLNYLYLNNNVLISIITSVLFGFSLVLNLSYLIKTKKQLKEKSKQ